MFVILVPATVRLKLRINLDGFSYMKHAVNSLGTTYKNQTLNTIINTNATSAEYFRCGYLLISMLTISNKCKIITFV